MLKYVAEQIGADAGKFALYARREETRRDHIARLMVYLAARSAEPDFLDGDHEHEHDDHVTSFSLVTEQPLDPRKFLPWTQMITQRFGMDILRMKGILSFKDDDDRFVVQAVHMLLEGDHQRPWKDNEPRVSRLVFIGRNLPKEIVEDGFMKCRAEPGPVTALNA
ncbi:hypothetical protein BQ8482_130054 [Mesorhizobium delmotii]|uniref:CobW C-terminal domain-containing protein n=2 Tax=Mesorhizobium delmotii TaxID=1631247 RepID=A0A2P9AG88_9HYPH|nr:hypothetical protein BQ8482_130054 [Mesorhizobium delmotii]